MIIPDWHWNGLDAQSLTAGGNHPHLRGDMETAMASQNERQSEQVEHKIKVRQVTDIQASWTEQERGEEGKFTLQLILDNGVEEYILQPEADDLEPMLKLFALSDHTTFDLERKVLRFSNLKTK
jgi:hypothetical protein